MFLIGVPGPAALFGDCPRKFTRCNPAHTFAFSRATSYAFQRPNPPSDEDDGSQVTLSSSAILKYVGIEKRDGLVSVGRRLLEGGRISSS
jgi:hypothetical protein